MVTKITKKRYDSIRRWRRLGIDSGTMAFMVPGSGQNRYFVASTGREIFEFKRTLMAAKRDQMRLPL